MYKSPALLRRVAIGPGHMPGERSERSEIIHIHVRWLIDVGVAVGVKDQLGIGVEVDSGRDIRVRQHEVHTTGSPARRRGPGHGRCRRRARRTSLHRPSDSRSCDSDRRRCCHQSWGDGSAPVLVDTVATSYSPPSGLTFGSGQISRVHQVGQRGVTAIAFGEQTDHFQSHLYREMLAGVVQGQEEHSRLGRIIHVRLVADLDGQDGPSLQASSAVLTRIMSGWVAAVCSMAVTISA